MTKGADAGTSPDAEWMTPTEAAVLLRVGYQPVWTRILKGQLHARRAGKRWWVRRSDVERLRDELHRSHPAHSATEPTA